MKLAENPFYVLNASPRDRKSRLIELTDEASLHGDQESATSARNVLSNSRTRLAAELSWFPGLSPSRVERALGQIKSGQIPSMDGMSALCQANFLVEALGIFASDGASRLSQGIEILSTEVEAFDIASILVSLNEDRQAAGFPLLTDPLLVEAELSGRIRHFERVATSLLEDLPTQEMVDTYESLISDNTFQGELEGDRLINSLMDSYELKASAYLNSEAESIVEMIDAATKASDNHATENLIRVKVVEIIQALEAWDRVAQPIQLARMSNGRNHDESHNLAGHARSLAIHLFNNHDYLDDAKLLSDCLHELFVEVASITDQIQSDVEALDDIAVERASSAQKELHEKAEFAREITYETAFGTIFKDKFRISPDGIDYKGKLAPFETISVVRWGAVRTSINGIPSGTEYHVGYGSSTWSVAIQPNERQYNEIIQRMWRAACIPILINWMDVWRNGRAVRIDGVEVTDDGLVLTRNRFFKGPENKFFPWGDLTKSSANGFLNFYGKSDKAFTKAFSYKDGWNVHVFDFAIDKIWEGKALKMSNIFGS